MVMRGWIIGFSSFTPPWIYFLEMTSLWTEHILSLLYFGHVTCFVQLNVV